MQLRRVVFEYYSSLLEENDVLALPLKRSDDIFEDIVLHALSSLCGFASVYTTYKGEPCLLMAKGKNENALFSLSLEEMI